MQQLSKRTAGFTDSVIRRMTRISNQYQAVNLSQGFPDFDPPKEILDRLAQMGRAEFSGGAGGETVCAYGKRDRPKRRDCRDLRQHGGDDGGHADGDKSG